MTSDYDSKLSLDSLGDIRAEIKRGVPFLVVKNALALETCDQIREHAYRLFKRLPNNEMVETLMARTDVLPPGTKTRRIFRSVNVLDGDPKTFFYQRIRERLIIFWNCKIR